MATIRSGTQGVLVVVDVQVGVVQNAWDAQRIVGNVARAVARARAQGVPVVWVQHHNDELKPGSPEWQWAPPLVPAQGEARIDKKYNSGFEQTELEATLAAIGATHIVLAGAESQWCIRATAYGAIERGYDLTLVKDAHSTSSIDLDNGEKLEAQSIIRDLNIAMTWLEYPGRTNGTATAEEVDFGRPGGTR